jgi:hypothetical protein
MTFLRSRRGFALVVVACAVASALVLLGASRTWSEVVNERPLPFPPLVTKHTGAGLEPWLPALAVVGLAGAGALVATRGLARAILGGLLIILGAVIVTLALLPFAGGADPLWPLVCAACGTVIGLAGLATSFSFAAWPVMGARYERSAPPPVARKPATQAELWDALDRGEDPTQQS